MTALDSVDRKILTPHHLDLDGDEDHQRLVAIERYLSRKFSYNPESALLDVKKEIEDILKAGGKQLAEEARAAAQAAVKLDQKMWKWFDEEYEIKIDEDWYKSSKEVTIFVFEAIDAQTGKINKIGEQKFKIREILESVGPTHRPWTPAIWGEGAETKKEFILKFDSHMASLTNRRLRSDTFFLREVPLGTPTRFQQRRFWIEFRRRA